MCFLDGDTLLVALQAETNLAIVAEQIVWTTIGIQEKVFAAMAMNF